MNQKLSTENATAPPLKHKNDYTVKVGIQFLLASASFWFGMPMWVALLDRNENGRIQYIWELVPVYLFLWVILLIPCWVLGFILVEATGRKMWTTWTTTWVPVILVISCILTAILEPQRLQARFSRDWKFPWPTSATGVQVMLGRGWLGHHQDRYHFHCNPADTEKLIQSRPLRPVDQTIRLNLIRYCKLAPKWASEEQLLSYDWFYVLPPNHDASSASHTFRGNNFLIITNAARDEVFLALDFHDG
jgi:hypothetical protein